MNNMSIALIVSNFGSFSPFFPFWLKSAEANTNLCFFFLTDNLQAIKKYDHCKNIHFIYFREVDFSKRVKDALGLDLFLKNPKKICDFRVAYGVLFSDLLKSFDFWGFCDTDVIFGNTSCFLTPDKLRYYDRIYRYGHFSLIKNTEENNHFYKKLHTDEGDDFVKVFSSDRIYCYEERIFCQKLQEDGKRVYVNDSDLADINRFLYRFYTHKKTSYGQRHFFLEWQKGDLWAVSKVSGQWKKTRIMYAHFQKRRIDICCDSLSDDLVIVPNRIIDGFGLSDQAKWKLASKTNFCYSAGKLIRGVYCRFCNHVFHTDKPY